MEPASSSAPPPAGMPRDLATLLRQPWLFEAGSAVLSGLVALVMLVVFIGVFSELRTPSAIGLAGVAWWVYAPLAVGLTIVMATGRVDLSGAAVAALVGAVGARLALVGVPVLLAFVPGAVLAVIVGAANGLGASISRQAAFVVTLATAAICQAGAGLLVGSSGAVLPHGGDLIPLIVPALVLAIAAVVIAVIGLASPYGDLLRKLGRERDAAPPIVMIPAFAAAALLAAAAGAVQVARVGAAFPEVSAPAQLAVIAAALLGGASLRGGRGAGYGAVVASLAVTILFFGLTASPLPSVVAVGLVGLLLVLVVLWDELRSRLFPAS